MLERIRASGPLTTLCTDARCTWRWYLIHTKPSSEATAWTNLDRQGYEVYLPRLVQPVWRGTQRRERIVPLFPRYLFLRLNEGHQSLSPARCSVGVSGIVRFGSNYAVVPDDVVRELRARADPESGLHRLSCPPRFRPGAVVRIAAGPFGGLEGILQSEVGAERVVVLLKLLGRETPVCVSACALVPGHAA